MSFSVLGLDVSVDGITLGVLIGMTYGVLAVGLILVYRSNRIINFAHGEIGGFGATVLALTVVRWHFPYWVALPLALIAGGAAGALVELAVVRRMRRAPKIMSIVATLGAGQFILLFSLAISSEVRSTTLFPQPVGLPNFQVGALRITPAHSGMLILTPLVVLGLTIFLRRSRFGLAIRGSAANPEAAQLAAVPAGGMSTLAWMIAGAISSFTAILVFPTRGIITPESLGPGLLLRALAAAVMGRMVNLPVGFAAGILLGVIEVTVNLNTSSSGVVEVILFVFILIALLFQRHEETRAEEKGSWIAVQPWKPLPEALMNIWSIRNLGRFMGGIALILALLIPVLSTNRTAIVLVSVLAFGLVGFSIGIVTGLAGQLSLGQFAVAGVGATVSYYVARRTGNYVVGFVAAGVAASFLSALIGIPALRIRGLMLAVTTLSFALMAQAWLLQRPWMLGSGVTPGRPAIGGMRLDTGKKYYFFALGFLILGAWLYRNLRAGGFGRCIVALRDNEIGARAFTVRAQLRKIQAFCVAGFLAGLGGAVYSHGLSSISFQTFSTEASINIVAMAVIGGLGIVIGPLLGALYVIGVPAFVDLDAAGLATTKLGWLLLILYFPSGLAGLVSPLRERLVNWLARRSGLDPETGTAAVAADFAVTVSLYERPLTATSQDGNVPGEVLLEAFDLHKQFGGVKAVDGVSLKVYSGEILGIIGPNGAGKTTCFDLISGFTPPNGGRVLLGGEDVTWYGPEARGRMGLIRSFQDAFLFPTMTVIDTVKLSFERTEPTRLLSSVLGLRATEKRKDERARELVHVMGLDSYRHKQINEISTGTRRITELACLLALEPKLLLLDEPSAGIAQRESEALGQLLSEVKEYLGTTFMLIEHDIPLVMGLSHRIIAMAAGQVIAEGTPAEVRINPLVIESYLGSDSRAIERSGVVSAHSGGHCRQVTKSGSRCSRPAGARGYCKPHQLTASDR